MGQAPSGLHTNGVQQGRSPYFIPHHVTYVARHLRRTKPCPHPIYLNISPLASSPVHARYCLVIRLLLPATVLLGRISHYFYANLYVCSYVGASGSDLVEYNFAFSVCCVVRKKYRRCFRFRMLKTLLKVVFLFRLYLFY